MVVFGDLPYDFRVYRAARTLIDAGYRVSLLAPRFDAEPLPDIWSTDHLVIDQLPMPRETSLRRRYPQFWRWATGRATQLAADIYHAHDLDALWPAARAARRHEARLVYDSHELFVGQSSLVSRPLIRGFWSLLETRLVSRADAVMTVSEHIADDLQQRYALATRPAVVRNLPPLREPLADDRLRQAIGASAASGPLALYQGGFLTDNGLLEVIDAMADVDTGQLVLLGGGPTEQALRQRVAAAGLQAQVHFLPRVPFADLHAWTCGADIGLCLIRPAGDSFTWSLPNKLFEYFQAGLPVLAGDTPQIRAVIEQTGAGLVVDPTDPSAIAGGLNVLFGDAAHRTELAGAARAAAQTYCWEQEAPRLLKLYEAL